MVGMGAGISKLPFPACAGPRRETCRGHGDAITTCAPACSSSAAAAVRRSRPEKSWALNLGTWSRRATDRPTQMGLTGLH